MKGNKVMKQFFLAFTALIALGIGTVMASSPGINLSGGETQTGWFQEFEAESVTITVTWTQPNRDLSLSVGYDEVMVSDTSSEANKSESLTIACPCSEPWFVHNLTDKNTGYDFEFTVNP